MYNNFSHAQSGPWQNPLPQSLDTRKLDPRRLRQRMVQEQIIGRGLNDPLLVQAMGSVPRHLFVPEAFRAHAYNDAPLPIGQGQTISQPYTVARMTLALNVAPGMRVLEVGAGSGYQAAVLAAMGCTVFGIERIGELCAATRMRLRKLAIRTVHIYKGDGTLGLGAAAPFDRILVSAGGPMIPPPLVAQLEDDGILVIPVGDRPGTQRLVRIRKNRNSPIQEDLGPAVFVDLIGNHGWQR